jgi:hypothetical protein
MGCFHYFGTWRQIVKKETPRVKAKQTGFQKRARGKLDGPRFFWASVLRGRVEATRTMAGLARAASLYSGETVTRQAFHQRMTSEAVAYAVRGHRSPGRRLPDAPEGIGQRRRSSAFGAAAPSDMSGERSTDRSTSATSSTWTSSSAAARTPSSCGWSVFGIASRKTSTGTSPLCPPRTSPRKKSCRPTASDGKSNCSSKLGSPSAGSINSPPGRRRS